ncbi:unnamed protein product [Caenorhabditis angaria]|uniref:Hikeshi-like domain-containing protein n=1 Tax=Caenorhabditis angaria TaxID=860376 RepID=A0A9P1INZ7_9PELO|nr:unnamed protein product [Caenorhabditis angaria]
MSGIFGVIVSGRLPIEVLPVSETEFSCEIFDADSINHVVVFLTGSQPFPDGFGGSVYIRWPTSESSMNWHYLGFVCNQKPSAIFKVAQLHKSAAQHSQVFGGGMSEMSHSSGSAQIGLIVEQLSIIEGKQASEGTSASQQSTLVEFADKMIRNLINHTESFTVKLPNANGQLQEFIPVNAFQSWYNSFSRRFTANPFFWKTLNNT